MANSDPRLNVPPQSIEAERAVLGALLLEDEPERLQNLFDRIADTIDASDFYTERHRTIWGGMEALISAKRPVDVITLGDVLRPDFEQIGGPEYLAELAAGVAAPSSAVHYAKLVREKSLQRCLATFGAEVARKANEAPAQWSPDWTEEQLNVAEYELAAIASRAVRKPEPQKAETLGVVLWNLEHGVRRGVPTGFKSLDRDFGGFDEGHLTILAARTSKGKTAFALHTALNIARTGYAVAFFTLEMTAAEMWTRALGCLGSVDTFMAARRPLSEGESAQLAQARDTLARTPLEILYRPSMRPRDFRIECRRLIRELGNLKLAVIDYLALMRGNHRERERWREMQEVVLALKEIAGELGIPILLLQQLNREVNDNLPPSLSHLRDTGASEEHASNVLFVWQEPTKAETQPTYGAWEAVNIILGKQRNGPAGLRVPMEFKKCWGAFRDIT